MSLRKITNQDKTRLNENCAVCLESMRMNSMDGNWPMKLHCGHIFHVECLETYATIRRTNTCPLCRQPNINEGFHPIKESGKWKWRELG